MATKPKQKLTLLPQTINARNKGIDLDLDWIASIQANTSAIERRASSIASRRSVKKQHQAAWLLQAVKCMDLTTLSGDDTTGRVKRLCAKAKNPISIKILEKILMAVSQGIKVIVSDMKTIKNREKGGTFWKEKWIDETICYSDTPCDYKASPQFRRYGIDFKKGCYVGQENTTRIKLKDKLSKRLLPIEIIDGQLDEDEKIYNNDVEIGKVLINQEYPYALIKYLDKNFSKDQIYKSKNGSFKIFIPNWLKI